MSHSLQQLDRKLSRITWVTVLPVMTVFLIAFWFVLYDGQKKSVLSEESFLSQVIDAQEKALQQEIFLNLEDGLQMRLDGIVQNERLKSAQMRACIRLIPLKNPGSNYISSCTTSTDAALLDNPSRDRKKRVLSIGVEPVANIEYFLLKTPSLYDFFPPKLIIAILLAAIGAFFIHRHAVRNLQKNVVSPLLRKIAQDERNTAIAKTMQMVTHDVRKPFLALRSIIESLISPNGTEAEPQALKTKVLPTLDQSIASVDAMLSDVLELGTSRELQPEDSSIVEAIARAMQTLIPLFPGLKVELDYEFYHRHMVRADSKHLLRVITNLVENALQAVNNTGGIWFRSRTVTRSGDRFVELTIGNTGSYIEENDLERIFDPFVTTKRWGYGLGLAIASKFVEDYGGKIWAISDKDQGTEFHVLLPASGKGEPINEEGLPSRLDPHSKQASLAIDSKVAKDGNVPLLLFDDEDCVRMAWELYAQKKGVPNLTSFSSWEDFIEKDAFDAVRGAVAFVDVNFKNSRFNGLDIATQLRKLGVQRIYAITADPRAALQSGLFDEVLGKDFPEHLLRVS